VRSILHTLLQLYLYVLFARIILSWFPISPGSGMASAYRALLAVTEPVLAPIRRLIPPVGLGGMGLDLSPIIVLIVVQILLSRI
jgi:YggT family protein